MALDVRLKVFEGPLDLLLFLIEKNKVDIYDIPIITITDQYLSYISEMDRQDMNTMSEFLVLAATLLDIKSRMLLPREENENGDEDDPRAELVERLLEYKMYKYMSYEFKDMYSDAGKNMYKKETLPDAVKQYQPPLDYDELLGDVTLLKLHEIFQNVMKKQDDKMDPIRSHFGKIEREEVDMEEKTKYVDFYIRSHDRMSFKELLEKSNSKAEVIVTFLVILEMMKTGIIDIVQEHTFDDIMITRRNLA